MQQSLQFLLPHIKCLLSGRREWPTTCFCICSTVQGELFTSSPWLSHMCLFWCWAHIQTSHVRHRAGDVPCSCSIQPPRNSWKNKEWEEGEEGGISALQCFGPFGMPRARGEMWAMLGHCILSVQPQAPIPWRPQRAGGVEKFHVEQQKKKKLFLHLITPAATCRVGEWVGLRASEGGSGRCSPTPRCSLDMGVFLGQVWPR